MQNKTLDLIRESGRRYHEELANGTVDATPTSFPTATSRRVEGLDDRMADLRAARNRRPVETTVVEINGFQVRLGTRELISEGQAKWITDIASRPSVTPEMRASLAVRLEQGFARSSGSQFIETYRDIPRTAPDGPTASQARAGHDVPEVAHTPAPAPVTVAAGRYAVEMDGTLKFYRVSLGKGRWAGRTFVEVQASDETYPVRNAKSREEILAAIAESPLEAEQRYGRELGKCARCARTLTDATSRAYGIGPDCRAK